MVHVSLIIGDATGVGEGKISYNGNTSDLRKLWGSRQKKFSINRSCQLIGSLSL